MIIKEGNNIISIRMEDGEDFFESLKTVCKNYKVESGIILNGIGMLRNLTIGYWDGAKYVNEEVKEPVELVSMQGNIGTTENDGDPIIHIHIAVAKSDHNVIGGHFVKGIVNNTGEIFIQKLDNIVLLRKKDKNGLMGLYPA
ncbi:MAG: DNA-binding protein [Caldisericaceae bacterium]|jgi:predicted DNA-binding protein with PD1-like motif|nr:DNA-binding protein [Caldisericaceae bacterium]